MANHIHDQLDHYLRDVLEPAARGQFDAHIEACGRCRQLVSEALEADDLLGMLAPTEAPPVPGPNFYFRVQDNIDKNVSQNWFSSLAATMRFQWTYPLVVMGILVAALALTSPNQDAEEGLMAMEYPSTDFAQMSFTEAAVDSNLGQDLVIMSLVDVSEPSGEEGGR